MLVKYDACLKFFNLILVHIRVRSLVLLDVVVIKNVVAYFYKIQNERRNEPYYF